MDLQNVSSLVIPEGEVKTIHDKNNRLLWGKLSYDTKYVGNAIQDGAPTPDAPVAIQTVTGTQTATVTGKNICSECKTGNSSKLLYFRLPRLNSGEIVLSATLSIPLSGNTYGLELDGTFTQLGTWSTASGNKLKRVFSLTDAQVQAINNSTNAWIRTYKSSGGFVIPSDAMIEYGTSVTAYEPYQAHSYTVNLGAIELTKIGSHQDYLYKNGNDWYVHKEVRKYTFASDDDWQTTSYGTNSWTLSGKFISSEYDADAVITMCEIGKGVSYNNRSSGDATSTCVCFRNAGNALTIRNTTITTQAAMQSAAAGSDFYYWAVPYDTKITDSTLISQLDAIHQFLTRYGYNAMVFGNLPLIIDKTNL